MTKTKKLCNTLIKEKMAKKFDTISYKYPNKRMQTLKTGKGHPVIYKCKLAPTVETSGANAVVVADEEIKKLEIRRFTPKECWRLMGFSDEAFNKAKAVPTSDTQLYKQAGNSIVVDCLYYILKELLFNKDNIKKTMTLYDYLQIDDL